MTYAEDRAVLETFGAALLRGQALLSGAEQAAHTAGWRAGTLGVEQGARMRALDKLTTARERVAYVVGYGMGRAELENPQTGATAY